MLITKEVEVKVVSSTIKHYKEKGYEIPMKQHSHNKNKLVHDLSKPLLIKVEDLPPSSEVKIECLCDYCLEEGIETIVPKLYKDYTHQKENSPIKKDCCRKCQYKKYKESNLLVHGVENTSQLPETREKFKQTSLDRYGATHPMKTEKFLEKMSNTCKDKYGSNFYMGTDDFKEKTKQYNQECFGVEFYTQSNEFKEKYKIFCQENYGVDNLFQAEIIKEKSKNTCLDKYGVENYTQTSECQEKIKQTFQNKYGVDHYLQLEENKLIVKQINLDRYGFENPMQNPEIRLKQMQSMYDNKNIRTSKQQKYICKLVNGELNYLIEDTEKYSFVDIAFLDEKIYIEWDGSGHKLSIIHGQKTEHEFNEREKARTYGLLKSGWKEIRIISEKDYLPSDVMIHKIINDSKLLFDEGFHRIVFDIDNNTYETSKFKKDYDFGKLHNTRNLVVD